MALVRVRLDETTTAPGNVPVTVAAVLVNGLVVVAGSRGVLPGIQVKRTDASGLSEFYLKPGRYEVSAQSTSGGPLFKASIDVPDDALVYEFPELIVDGAGEFLAGPATYSALQMERAGFRLQDDEIQLWNEEQGAWCPVWLTGLAGFEQLVIGVADPDVSDADPSEAYTRAELEDAGFRLKHGELQLWNETQSLWHAIFVTGASGSEQTGIGIGEA